jgi:response regulator of citrate/malate metabolism
LQLTVEQKQRVQQPLERMKTEAKAVGEKQIASERELDQEFATHMDDRRSTEIIDGANPRAAS